MVGVTNKTNLPAILSSLAANRTSGDKDFRRGAARLRLIPDLPIRLPATQSRHVKLLMLRSPSPSFAGWFRVALALAGLCVAARPVVASDVSFRNDVMAVLSKSGCNLGTCHGNARRVPRLRLSRELPKSGFSDSLQVREGDQDHGPDRGERHAVSPRSA